MLQVSGRIPAFRKGQNELVSLAYLSLSDFHDLEKNQNSAIDSMHVSSLVKFVLESILPNSTAENEIIENRQIVEFDDVQIQEQEKNDDDLTFILSDNFETLVVHETMEDKAKVGIFFTLSKSYVH